MTRAGARIGAVAAVALTIAWPGALSAGPYRVGFVIEPAYTFCLSGGSTCSPAGRTSFAVEYKPIVSRKLDLRVKLTRSYDRSSADAGLDDITVDQASRYQAAADALDLRLRLFDGDGFERQEPRAGYAYQHPEGNSSGHHSIYASDRLFFGRGIQRGTAGAARQFSVLVKVSKDAYEPAGSIPQTFVQTGAFVTFPLDASGRWRTEESFTLQQQIVDSGLAPFSTRLSASLTHDFSVAVRAYLRLDSKLSTAATPSGGNARATTLVAGGKFTF